jgi:hypothetical protein
MSRTVTDINKFVSVQLSTTARRCAGEWNKHISNLGNKLGYRITDRRTLQLQQGRLKCKHHLYGTLMIWRSGEQDRCRACDRTNLSGGSCPLPPLEWSGTMLHHRVTMESA